MLRRERGKKPVNNYKRKFEEVSAELWAFQNIPETDEEMNYRNLCADFQNMLVENSQETHDSESLLHEKIETAKDTKDIQEELERLQNIYQNLLDLKKSILDNAQ